jgi:hypothetical protein
MGNEGQKVRYRRHLDTLDNLQKDVRELTSEIRSARQELLNELPARRRADIRYQSLAARLPYARAAEEGPPDKPKRKSKKP